MGLISGLPSSGAQLLQFQRIHLRILIDVILSPGYRSSFSNFPLSFAKAQIKISPAGKIFGCWLYTGSLYAYCASTGFPPLFMEHRDQIAKE
ncbi:MAG TPA: hypothetical protein VFA74_18230 [Terriglobales bacterium]|nr:hypothetical protein [Terriglobales bacterium]